MVTLNKWKGFRKCSVVVASLQGAWNLPSIRFLVWLLLNSSAELTVMCWVNQLLLVRSTLLDVKLTDSTFFSLELKGVLKGVSIRSFFLVLFFFSSQSGKHQDIHCFHPSSSFIRVSSGEDTSEKKKQSTEIIKFSTTISAAHWQKKTPSLKFYLGIHFFFVFLFLSPSVCCLSHLSAPFLSPFMFFSPLLSLSTATGLLAVCQHLTEHQVPLSGKLYIAKHRGYGHHPTLALTHTHTISVCVHAHSGSTQHVQKCDTLKQTHINLNTHNPCFRPPASPATEPGFWLLKGNSWGQRKPAAKHRFSRCINDLWWSEECFIEPHSKPTPGLCQSGQVQQVARKTWLLSCDFLSWGR